MEIKPGKYRTRNDARAVVTEEVISGNSVRLFGRILYKNEWYPASWTLDGESTNNHFNDLIAPWEEPKPRMRFWRNGLGLVRLTNEDMSTADSLIPWQPVPELDALFERSEE